MTFAFYFDSHCPSISLSSAAALFTSLIPNAAKSFISFGHIKHHPKAWRYTEVEEAVIERHKRLLLQLTQVMKIIRFTYPLFDKLCLSSPRHGRRHDLFSCPNLCTISFVLLLAALPNLPSLQTCPTVLPGSGLQSLPIT